MGIIPVSMFLELMGKLDIDANFRTCKHCGMRKALIYNPSDDKKLPNGRPGKPIHCRAMRCPYWISSTMFYDRHKSDIKKFIQQNHRQLNSY